MSIPSTERSSPLPDQKDTTAPEAYPLSPVQEGMLFHSLHSEQPGMYLEQLTAALPEPLHVPAFERAWAAVVARHAVLRTSFEWDGLAEPVQRVHPHIKVPLEQHDCRGCSLPDSEARLGAYLEADRRRGFDLARAPLTRLAMFQVAPEEYRLVWTFHHALLDGRSVLIVLREVFALYEAFRSDQALDLDAPRPYRDYIAWWR